MRILALNWRDIRSPEAGGSEIHLHAILKRLAAWGHSVTLICAQFVCEPGPEREIVDGVRTIRVGKWWNAHWTVPAAAKRLLEEESFDVVIDDVNKIPFFAPRFTKTPVVAIFHHLLGNSVFLETNPVFAAAIRLYESQVGRVYRNTRSVAVSRSTAEDLVREGIPRDNLVVAPPGLDREVHRADLVEKASHPLIVVVSRLKRYKRVDVAIRAFAEIRSDLPDAELVVIGDGDQRRDLEALARTLRLPARFLGQVSDEQKALWLNRARLVINPSSKEGWGMVAVEAMACGTPVVASDIPGHRDSVPEGVGIRVPYGDVGRTAAAATRLLRSDGHYEHLRQEGLLWSQRQSWEGLARGFEGLLAEEARGAAAGIPLTNSIVTKA